MLWFYLVTRRLFSVAIGTKFLFMITGFQKANLYYNYTLLANTCLFMLKQGIWAHHAWYLARFWLLFFAYQARWYFCLRDTRSSFAMVDHFTLLGGWMRWYRLKILRMDLQRFLSVMWISSPNSMYSVNLVRTWGGTCLSDGLKGRIRLVLIYPFGHNRTDSFVFEFIPGILQCHGEEGRTSIQEIGNINSGDWQRESGVCDKKHE